MIINTNIRLVKNDKATILPIRYRSILDENFMPAMESTGKIENTRKSKKNSKDRGEFSNKPSNNKRIEHTKKKKCIKKKEILLLNRHRFAKKIIGIPRHISLTGIEAKKELTSRRTVIIAKKGYK